MVRPIISEAIVDVQYQSPLSRARRLTGFQPLSEAEQPPDRSFLSNRLSREELSFFMWPRTNTARMQHTAAPDKGTTSRTRHRGQLLAREFFLSH
jgi:hypothetical protein